MSAARGGGARARICLVTTSHAAFNPRAVKEASALHRAGYEVRLVALEPAARLRKFDDALARRSAWRLERIAAGEAGVRRRWRWLRGAVRQRAAHTLWRFTGGEAWRSRAVCRYYPELVRQVIRQPADLVIAHTLEALPVAATAADRLGAALGFDAEDLHSGTYPDRLSDSPGRRLAEAVERVYIPLCRHLTAASPGIAGAYAQLLGVESTPVLNVLPLAEAPAEAAAAERETNEPPSLYWFSQTIGPGRGLEELIRALGRVGRPVRLVLRGYPAAGYCERLRAAAGEAGVAERLSFEPPAPPERMAELAARHTLGLSLELPDTPNHRLCLANKIFTYLLAGLPQLISRTPAQEALAPELGEAATLVDLEDPRATAGAVQALLADRRRLMAARTAAWRLARERFNWDLEQGRFLASVERALSSRG